ncbi:MAG: hypothetical protein AAFX93_19925 [Verrucomicrobiota bacterium]
MHPLAQIVRHLLCLAKHYYRAKRKGARIHPETLKFYLSGIKRAMSEEGKPISVKQITVPLLLVLAVIGFIATIYLENFSLKRDKAVGEIVKEALGPLESKIDSTNAQQVLVNQKVDHLTDAFLDTRWTPEHERLKDEWSRKVWESDPDLSKFEWPFADAAIVKEEIRRRKED